MTHVRIEWKPEDCWIGLFWRRFGLIGFDMWVCIVPMLPLHITYRNPSAPETPDTGGKADAT